MRGLLASLLTAGLCAAPALAGGPNRGSPAPGPGKVVLELWDAAFLVNSMTGQLGRAGHVHTVTVEHDQDGQKVLRTTVSLRLTVMRHNDPITLAMDTGSLELPDGKVVGVFMRQYLGKQKTLEIAGTVEGKQLTLVRDGAKPLRPAPWDDRVVGLYRQQTLLRDRQVKPGDTFNYLSFEPTVNLVLRTDVEVNDYEEVALFTGQPKRRLLRVESRPQPLEQVQLPSLVSWLDGDGNVVRSQVEAPGLGKLFLYRTTKEAATVPGQAAQLEDIGRSQLVALTNRIARPFDTTAARYRVTIRGGKDVATTFSRDDRQAVRGVNGNSFELVVRADAAEKGADDAEPPGAEYLQSSYFINSADARVKNLARQAVGDEADAWRKALRIERWVHGRMTARNHEALATADHVARTLEGDCTEYAMLTAAMCRAAGVPSRTAVGLVYADVRDRPVFAFHMWTEVWAGGRWRPLDATLGQGRVGATHLKIADQNWHDERSQTPLLPVLRVLGRVSIDVLDVQGR